MQAFQFTLQETYYRQGFFNARVAFDPLIRDDNGSIKIYLGRSGKYINGHVNRDANLNNTARIYGSRDLREWFQSEFTVMDTLSIEIITPEVIRLTPGSD